MPFMSRRAALVTAALLGAVVAVGIAQGRQGRGDRPPDAPLPNIREYKPRLRLSFRNISSRAPSSRLSTFTATRHR
jgi:hypothetical protein